MLSAARQNSGTRCGRPLTLTAKTGVPPGSQHRPPAAMIARRPARPAAGDAALRTSALQPWIDCGRWHPPVSGGADLNRVSTPDEGFCFGSGVGRDEAGDGGFGGIHGSEDALSHPPAGEPGADEKDQGTVRGAVLAQPVQTERKIDPHSGATVVFRAKRGDGLKVLLWDGADRQRAGTRRLRLAKGSGQGTAAVTGAA